MNKNWIININIFHLCFLILKTPEPLPLGGRLMTLEENELGFKQQKVNGYSCINTVHFKLQLYFEKAPLNRCLCAASVLQITDLITKHMMHISILFFHLLSIHLFFKKAKMGCEFIAKKKQQKKGIHNKLRRHPCFITWLYSC